MPLCVRRCFNSDYSVYWQWMRCLSAVRYSLLSGMQMGHRGSAHGSARNHAAHYADLAKHNPRVPCAAHLQIPAGNIAIPSGHSTGGQARLAIAEWGLPCALPCAMAVDGARGAVPGHPPLRRVGAFAKYPGPASLPALATGNWPRSPRVALEWHLSGT